MADLGKLRCRGCILVKRRILRDVLPLIHAVDRIVGLEIGADDYLSKPFNPRELLARVRAILRRSVAAPGRQDSGLLCADGLELNSAARTVLLSGVGIDLTDVEFALLEALMRSPGTVVTRE